LNQSIEQQPAVQILKKCLFFDQFEDEDGAVDSLIVLFAAAEVAIEEEV